MAKGYLIDTSAVIKYLNGTFPEKSLERLDRILDKESTVIQCLLARKRRFWRKEVQKGMNSGIINQNK